MSETNSANTTPNPDAVAGTPPPSNQSGEGQPPAGAGTAEGQQPPAGGDVLDSGKGDGAQPPSAGDVLSVDDEPKQEGVPDSYSFDPPEGFDTSLIDEERLGAFMEEAKKHGLSQAQFQGIMSYYAERTQASVDEAVTAWNDRVSGWKEAARADKEFGGQNYDANVTTALQAVEKFGDGEFKALLKSPSADNPEGLAIGNHPAVLRFLNRIGKAIGDPTLVQGDGVKEADSNEARMKRLYPSMFKESA